MLPLDTMHHSFILSMYIPHLLCARHLCGFGECGDKDSASASWSLSTGRNWGTKYLTLDKSSLTSTFLLQLKGGP